MNPAYATFTFYPTLASFIAFYGICDVAESFTEPYFSPPPAYCGFTKLTAQGTELGLGVNLEVANFSNGIPGRDWALGIEVAAGDGIIF